MNLLFACVLIIASFFDSWPFTHGGDGIDEILVTLS